MNAAQEYAIEILPLVKAQAEGETIQMPVDGDGWLDCNEPTAYVKGCKYRIKPRTIMVNGFEVLEPMRVEPCANSEYYLSCPTLDAFATLFKWGNLQTESLWLSRGLCHSTKEAAIAHAKAMLGIDPNE